MVIELLLGAAASLTVGLLIAIVTGKLVPSSKVEERQREIEKWKASYEELKTSSNRQEKLLERIVLTADVTERVMSQVRSEVDSSEGGGC